MGKLQDLLETAEMLSRAAGIPGLLYTALSDAKSLNLDTLRLKETLQHEISNLSELKTAEKLSRAVAQSDIVA